MMWQEFERLWLQKIIATKSAVDAEIMSPSKASDLLSEMISDLYNEFLK